MLANRFEYRDLALRHQTVPLLFCFVGVANLWRLAYLCRYTTAQAVEAAFLIPEKQRFSYAAWLWILGLIHVYFC
jgi:hypothetical protein